MSEDTHVERRKGEATEGTTDYERLKNMTEDEVEDNAKNDPDAPLLNDEELKKFRRVNQKKE